MTEVAQPRRGTVTNFIFLNMNHKVITINIKTETIYDAQIGISLIPKTP